MAAQGLAVKRIICHLWVNRVNPETPMEIIDNLLLEFIEDKVLCIGCNPEGDGLDVLDFNLQATAKAMEQEFGGKIKVLPADASGTKMWADVVGKKLESVKLTRSGEYYKADSLILDFGSEKREISISPMDGLIIDYYEE